MDMARRLLFLMGLLILLTVVSTSASTVSASSSPLSTAPISYTTSDSSTAAPSGSTTNAGSAITTSSESPTAVSSGSPSTASSGITTAASSGSTTDSITTVSTGHISSTNTQGSTPSDSSPGPNSTPTTASGGQDNSSTGGQTSTDSTYISSTKGTDHQCYNHTCVSNSTGCLKEAIDNNSAKTCSRGDEYCKITKTTKNGQHTINAECVSKSCEFSSSTSATNGEITFNCCQSDRCNTEDILKGTATLLLPSCLLLSIVTLFTLVTSST